MPSIRKPLSTRQKIIAVYTDPNVHALADHVARTAFGTEPGHPDYRRHVTCFLLDLEARLHGNRQKTKRQVADDRETWNLRRELAGRITGEDRVLAQPPTEVVVRKWRERFVPTSNVLEKPRPVALAAYIEEFERLAMRRAHELGQFSADTDRNLAQLSARNVCSGDGSYISAYSKVKEAPDPQSEEPKSMFLGARNPDARREDGKVRGTRVQDHVHRKPKAGRQTMGVNHVAILTRTEYGRIILGVERAIGGEVHTALKLMDRIAPLAENAIHAMTYDKALTGWQCDYLLAKHGIISIAPPTAESETSPEHHTATQLAEDILAARANSAATDHSPNGEVKAKAPKKPLTYTKDVKLHVAKRILADIYDADDLRDAIERGEAVGSGLPLGTNVYLNSKGNVTVVQSVSMRFNLHRHVVDAQICNHDLHVDDGALWDTRYERGIQVKHRRLLCTDARTKVRERTGWHELRATYQLFCDRSGHTLEIPVDKAPSGKWMAKRKNPPRAARQSMMILAPCDAEWSTIYGLRNDCESWFSWLKQQLLDDKRAPSLDLNHQLLDVLHAALITNSITLFHARREAGAVAA